jgi:diacylglycerol kinase (ATP)
VTPATEAHLTAANAAGATVEGLRPWVAIQRNRRSGAGRQYRALTALIRELRRQGWQPRLFSSRGELDAAVRRRPDHPPRAIVAAGGDGTVLDVLSRHSHLPMAILPLGTENLLARYYGIPPRDGTAVARMIVAGRTRRIDLGVVGERRFSVLVSCGFDAEVVRRLHEGRRGPITRLHYAVPLAQTLASYPYPEVRTYVDDATEPLSGGMVVVANLPRYGLHLPLVPTAVPDDGLFDVRIFPHRSVPAMLYDILRLVLRWSRWEEDMPCVRGQRVRIESDRPTPVEVDGDPLGTTPVELRIEPSAATLYVP